MKRIVYWLILPLLLSACSTTKNTKATRTFHAMKVKYNIFYNGNVAFIDGQQAVKQAHTDDFTQIIPLYPVSDHKAAEASTSQMDRTIEKCRKAIKLHSIKAKPKPDPKKRSDPQYKAWLQQEEFNPAMGNVWVRLAEAEFMKGDFLGSIGTCTYVIRHYSHDPEIIARCQLLMARAYGEMGWQYEAEDWLEKTEVDVLSRKYAPLYSAAKADILLKAKRYKEALPFVKIALPAEKRKVYRPRFQYVLAQLYEQAGNKAEAANAYKKVIQMAPPTDMEFNARIRRAQLLGKSSIKSLKTMSKQSKYKDHLDEIYGAIGNIYLQAKDTAKAIENYNFAIEKSTRAEMPKAQILITLADLYYNNGQYPEAQPHYQEASTILTTEHEDYARVLKRAETLEALIREFDMIHLQDSLQFLSTLTEEEQMAVAQKIVEDLIAAEEKAAEDEALAIRKSEIDEGPLGVNTSKMFGGGGSADWYFYNAQLMKNGSQEFRRLWGNRTLEDNWRRASKTSAAVIASDEIEDLDALAADSTALEGDSTALAQSAAAAIETDPHKPEFYLQQIPKTPADFAASDSLIADAMVNLIYIYKDEVEDRPQALDQTRMFTERFNEDARIIDIWYMWYLTALKENDTEAMDYYRSLIVSRYPQSPQAQIVSDPAYFDKLRQMALEQDSIYERTYEAYKHSRFKEVLSLTEYVEQNYPLTPLMPRFLFLKSVAIARTKNQDAFIEALRDLVTRYPEHSLSAMAKDFLAMMGQGMESQKGAMTSNLDELRGQQKEDEKADEQQKTFSAETHVPSVVIMALPQASETLLNELLYQVALFNFTQFLIRDFDLRPMPVFGDGAALRVCGFETLDEANWYIGLTRNNIDLTQQLVSMGVKLIPITEENADLLNTKFSVEDYELFLQPKPAKSRKK